MRWQLIRIVATLCLLLALPQRGVSAGDVPEFERRLIAIGVDAALRAEIMEAIRRGAGFLVGRQAGDGSFAERWEVPVGMFPPNASPAYDSEGVTGLCGLALLHCDTPDSRVAATRAIAWLVSNPDRVESLLQRTYDAGLVSLLLPPTAPFVDLRHRLAGALAVGVDQGSGNWGYSLPRNPDRYATKGAPFVVSGPNLSTSQFGALGLWELDRERVGPPLRAWVRHAEMLLSEQGRNGSWMYSQKVGSDSADCDIQIDYFNGTFIGISNLHLARAALFSVANGRDRMMERIDAAITAAQIPLRRDVLALLQAPMRGTAAFSKGSLLVEKASIANAARPAQPGIGAYYRLFSLAKACIFSRVETFEAGHLGGEAKGPGRVTSPTPGGARARPSASGAPSGSAAPGAAETVAWYRAGARWILDRQRSDGGWSPNPSGTLGDSASEIDSAFALLFLLRVADRYSPTLTERSTGQGQRPTTPSSRGATADPTGGK